MNPTSSPRRAALGTAALVAALVNAGCLSAPDPPTYRYLTPVAPPIASADAATGGAGGARVFLRDVMTDDSARGVLAWRTGPGRIERRDTERWAEDPGEFLRRVALERLAESGAHSPADGTALVDLELLFFGGAGGATEPRARLELFATVRSAAGTLLVARRYERERALAADDWRTGLATELGRLTAEALDAVLADARAAAATDAGAR